jgi:iron complex outermembrane receptor protein
MSDLDEDCFYYQTYGALNQNGKPILCNEPDKDDPYGNEGNNNLKAMLYHDLQVSYAASWNGVFTLGGRNIFGSEPPTVNNSFAHSFDGSYDLPGGAYWYASYKQNF